MLVGAAAVEVVVLDILVLLNELDTLVVELVVAGLLVEVPVDDTVLLVVEVEVETPPPAPSVPVRRISLELAPIMTLQPLLGIIQAWLAVSQ